MAGNYDLFIRITYDLKKDESRIRTNIQSESVDDVLTTFLSTQIGKGEDKRKPARRQVYHINLEVDLSYDTFRVSHDTGNLGLRDGIIMQTIGNWIRE